jgi:hypothetical protein
MTLGWNKKRRRSALSNAKFAAVRAAETREATMAQRVADVERSIDDRPVEISGKM